MWDLIASVPDHCLSFYFVHKSSWSKGQLGDENGVSSYMEVGPDVRPELTLFQALKYTYRYLFYAQIYECPELFRPPSMNEKQFFYQC